MEKVDKNLALSHFIAFRYILDNVLFMEGGVNNTISEYLMM